MTSLLNVIVSFQCIVLVPTRELAQQVADTTRSFASALNLNLACVYGGSDKYKQIQELQRGMTSLSCPN